MFLLKNILYTILLSDVNNIQYCMNLLLSHYFGLGGASDKISSKVAKISVWSGDIQQKITQQRLLKIFEQFLSKSHKNLKILQNLSRKN